MWGDVLGRIEVLFVYKECGENQPPYQTMSGGLGSGGIGGLYSAVIMERVRLAHVVGWPWADRRTPVLLIFSVAQRFDDRCVCV
ncbi:MAG: hypothetical protein ACI9FZ_001251 [Bacteroidia bacterium]|jgi:hypothetical protein